MAARRPFWKWHRWKSLRFCLWPPSTCIWNLKLKFQSKLDLCSGNHVVYRRTDGQTDRRTDGRTRWIQYTPPPTSLGGGIIKTVFPRYGDSHVKDKTGARQVLSLNMGIPILLRRHLYIKMSSQQYRDTHVQCHLSGSCGGNLPVKSIASFSYWGGIELNVSPSNR